MKFHRGFLPLRLTTEEQPVVGKEPGKVGVVGEGGLRTFPESERLQRGGRLRGSAWLCGCSAGPSPGSAAVAFRSQSHRVPRLSGRGWAVLWSPAHPSGVFPI